MIEYVTGDATRPQGDLPRIIVHICNDVGGWGRGFVVAISKRWKGPEKEYRDWYAGRANNDFGLGAVQFVQVEDTLWVANMIGQHKLRRGKTGAPPIRYDAVDKALGVVAEKAVELGASVHMPRIGCGLAGGKWEEIEPIIQRTLSASEIATVVYDFG